MRNKNSYLCPKDILSTNYPNRKNKLSSYVWDGSACGFNSGNAYVTCKTAQIWSPMCYLFWEPDDSVAGAGEFNDAANFPTAPPAGTEGIGLLHNKSGGNIMRLDGGVEFITATNLPGIQILLQAKGRDRAAEPNSGGAPFRGRTLNWLCRPDSKCESFGQGCAGEAAGAAGDLIKLPTHSK